MFILCSNTQDFFLIDARNADDSPSLWTKEATHKRFHTGTTILYDFEEQAKLVFDDRNKNNDYRCWYRLERDTRGWPYSIRKCSLSGSEWWLHGCRHILKICKLKINALYFTLLYPLIKQIMDPKLTKREGGGSQQCFVSERGSRYRNSENRSEKAEAYIVNQETRKAAPHIFHGRTSKRHRNWWDSVLLWERE